MGQEVLDEVAEGKAEEGIWGWGWMTTMSSIFKKFIGKTNTA